MRGLLTHCEIRALIAQAHTKAYTFLHDYKSSSRGKNKGDLKGGMNKQHFLSSRNDLFS